MVSYSPQHQLRFLKGKPDHITQLHIARFSKGLLLTRECGCSPAQMKNPEDVQAAAQALDIDRLGRSDKKVDGTI